MPHTNFNYPFVKNGPRKYYFSHLKSANYNRPEFDTYIHFATNRKYIYIYKEMEIEDEWKIFLL